MNSKLCTITFMLPRFLSTTEYACFTCHIDIIFPGLYLHHSAEYINISISVCAFQNLNPVYFWHYSAVPWYIWRDPNILTVIWASKAPRLMVHKDTAVEYTSSSLRTGARLRFAQHAAAIATALMALSCDWKMEVFEDRQEAALETLIFISLFTVISR